MRSCQCANSSSSVQVDGEIVNKANSAYSSWWTYGCPLSRSFNFSLGVFRGSSRDKIVLAKRNIFVAYFYKSLLSPIFLSFLLMKTKFWRQFHEYLGCTKQY